MAGSPLKRARRDIAEQALFRAAEERLREKALSNSAIDVAILRGYEEGRDPVDLMLPTARALLDAAEAGDVGAVREVFDRVSGKVVQEVSGDVGGITVQILNLTTDRASLPEPARLALAGPDDGETTH